MSHRPHVLGYNPRRSLIHTLVSLSILTYLPTMATQSLPELPPQYAKGIELIDDAHRDDPNLIDSPDGPKTLPYEVHYARKMTHWLAKRSPDASPALQVACRAQHFRRFVSLVPLSLYA